MAAVSSHKAHRPTATSMSSSYGIVFRTQRKYVIVNAGFGDPMDALLEMETTGNRPTCYIKNYYEGIKNMLYDAQRPYETVQLIFTENNGSVVSARYLYFNESGESLCLPNIEGDAQRSMRMARYVLWCDYVRNDLPNAIKDAIETSILGKEKEDEEICVICLREYKAEDMIGTLRCKHFYHDECIKKWLRKTIERDCPMCRDRALNFLGS